MIPFHVVDGCCRSIFKNGGVTDDHYDIKIDKEFGSDRGKDFDTAGATEAVARWQERTARILADRVCEAEAARLREMTSAPPPGQKTWHFGQKHLSLNQTLVTPMT